MNTNYSQNDIIHSGVAHDENPPGRGSGRFGWGTGDNPYQHMFNFLQEVNSMRKAGMSDSDIAKGLIGEVKVYEGKTREATVNDLKAGIAIAETELRKRDVARAYDLYNKTGSLTKTAQAMNKSVSSVQALLDPTIAKRTSKYTNTAEMLKNKIEKSEAGIIDISNGTEVTLGVPKNTKDVAVAMLEDQGYVRSWIKTPIPGTNKAITYNVLVKRPEGMSDKELYRYVQNNRDKVDPMTEYSPDQGVSYFVPEFPANLDSKRVFVKYAEDGGKLKDGVVELRKGVKDLSLGNSEYAQVRIMVDNNYYIKGMAMYSDDIPNGYDIVVNSNKHKGTPLEDVLKPLKKNKQTGEVIKEQPFGATIKAGGQSKYIGNDGKEHLSPINKISEEGDWDSWSKTLSQQFLSKQPLKLIRQQLNLTIDGTRLDLEKIQNLTNPALKQRLLFDFADKCDAKAADLSATGFKNQAFQVLLASDKVKEGEIYAPNYKDGETVALVRYPHQGIFEIPVLKNNTKNKDARSILSLNAKDAVLINSKTAEVLSGADFDGDTAIVIPMTSDNLKISRRDPLPQLKGFDPKELYSIDDPKVKAMAPEEYMKDRTKQTLMGEATNLVTDMTVGNASMSDIAKATKFAQVVIDAQKHKLDYKQAKQDNDINNLKFKYQGKTKNGQPKGASTILSLAGAKAYIPDQKEVTDRNKMTPEELKWFDAGGRVYRPSGKTKKKYSVDSEGNVTYKEELSTERKERMYTVKDARDLVRDKNNEKEMAYADFANEMKRLGMQARKEARAIKPQKVNISAKETYKNEIDSLNQKLKDAQVTDPLERKARTYSQKVAIDIMKSNPGVYDSYESRQRLKDQQLTKARALFGSKKKRIDISEREWEAIQSNALSTEKVKQIIRNSDLETVKKLAMPRRSSDLTPTELSMLKSMVATGMYTNADIAERLSVSPSTVSKYVKGE